MKKYDDIYDKLVESVRAESGDLGAEFMAELKPEIMKEIKDAEFNLEKHEKRGISPELVIPIFSVGYLKGKLSDYEEDSK